MIAVIASRPGRKSNIAGILFKHLGYIELTGNDRIGGPFAFLTHANFQNRPVVSEFYSYPMGHHQALFNNEYKLMVYGDKRGPKYKDIIYGDKSSPELYVLEKDPLEKLNLAKKIPHITLEMKKKLADWNKEHPARYKQKTEEKEISQESIKGLKALGYIQ